MSLLDSVTFHPFPKIFTGDSQVVRILVNFTAVFGQCTADSLTWSSTPLINAPSPRHSHTAIWTGNEMIIWGGNVVDTGGKYTP